MANEQKKKRRNILQKIIGGFGSLGKEKHQQRGIIAGIEGSTIYTKKIPSSLPGPVKQTARTKINAMAQKGNYAGIRKYLKGLSD